VSEPHRCHNKPRRVRRAVSGPKETADRLPNVLGRPPGAVEIGRTGRSAAGPTGPNTEDQSVTKMVTFELVPSTHRAYPMTRLLPFFLLLGWSMPAAGVYVRSSFNLAVCCQYAEQVVVLDETGRV